MVRIRLVRVGRKHKPIYRVMVADARSANKGRFIDNIGHCNPRTDPETVVIKADRAVYWLSRGAQPSRAVERLLKAQQILDENGALRPDAVPAAETSAPDDQTAAADAAAMQA